MALIKKKKKKTNTVAVMNYPIISDLEPKIFSRVSHFYLELFCLQVCVILTCEELAICCECYSFQKCDIIVSI